MIYYFFKLICLGESFSLFLMISNYPGCFTPKINAELVSMMLFCSAHWECFLLDCRLFSRRSQQPVKSTSFLERLLIHSEPPSALPADSNEQRAQLRSASRSAKDGDSVWTSHGRKGFCRQGGSQRGCQSHRLLLTRGDNRTQSEPCLSYFEQLGFKCPDQQNDNYQSVWNTTWGPRNRSWFAECSWHEKFAGVSWQCVEQPTHLLPWKACQRFRYKGRVHKVLRNAEPPIGVSR